MLPFSVLRTWGLGFFSWLVLGLGIWLGYEAYQEFKQAPSEVSHNRRTQLEPSASNLNENNVAGVDRPGETTRRRAATDDWRRWTLLLGAVLCLGITVGGRLPISYLLSSSAGRQRQSLQPMTTLSIERPNNSRLHVEIYGDRDAPTIILTHGWSLNTTAWDYLKADLADRYRVVLWDLPGMGQSRGPDDGDYSLERMAADLASVLKETSNAQPVVLVGHSIGGMILQTFARTQRERLQNVQGLAFVHTTYTNPLRTNFCSSLTTALETPVIVPLNWLNIILWPLAWLSNWQSYLNGSLHISTRFSSFTGKQSRQQLDHGAWLAAVAHPANVARGNLAMLKFNEEQVLPTIELPSLVIAGEHDRMTLPTASTHIETLVPNDRPMSVDSGHLGHWELGDKIAEAIVEFADSVQSDRGGRVSTRGKTERVS
jgi:pimeloyl-ACP methyl ester carboxylesterase